MSVERFLRRPKVEEITGLSRSGIYQKMADGQFPKPVRISEGRVAWRESEIAAWQARRVADRNRAA